MIEKSFKKARITLNIDESEDDLFITNNDKEKAEEIVAEADQMVAEADNEEKVDIEIVNKKVDESIDDISSVAFAESDLRKKNFIECVKVQKSIGKKVN